MSRKLTYEFVKEQFEKEGYALLSKEYIGSDKKLSYICPNGHQHSIRWEDWQQGYRCPFCASNKKLTIDFIKSEFVKEDYKLLTTEYKNNKQPLDYICPNGHQHSINWNNWSHGHGCKICGIESQINKQKISFDVVKFEFEKEGYRLLSTEYTNNKQKLNCICPNGHYHSISFNNWRHGYRCPTCANINKFGSGNPNWKGGISLEPYCQVWKDKEYKSDIRERDGNVCLNPCCDSKNLNDLVIHHIDYDKKNCAPQNLITVCRGCNFRANYNRKWHTAWYRTILNKRYGYKYQEELNVSPKP